MRYLTFEVSITVGIDVTDLSRDDNKMIRAKKLRMGNEHQS